MRGVGCPSAFKQVSERGCVCDGRCQRRSLKLDVATKDRRSVVRFHSSLSFSPNAAVTAYRGEPQATSSWLRVYFPTRIFSSLRKNSDEVHCADEFVQVLLLAGILVTVVTLSRHATNRLGDVLQQGPNAVEGGCIPCTGKATDPVRS